MDLHREIFATTECAADAAQVDPHHLRRQREARRHLIAVDVQPLRRDMDVDPALAVGNGESRLRSEERLILDPDLVDTGDGDLALGLWIAVPDQHRADDVRARIVAIAVAPASLRHRRAIRMERLLLERPLHLGDRLERLVDDPDGGGRATRLLGFLSGDDRDGLSEVADSIGSEHRLVGELEPVGLLAGHVLVREDGVDAGQSERLGDVELEDPRMGVRAADGLAPEHPRRVEIARVRELACDLRNPVVTRDGIADSAALELATICARAAPGGRRAHENRHAFGTSAMQTTGVASDTLAAGRRSGGPQGRAAPPS